MRDPSSPSSVASSAAPTPANPQGLRFSSNGREMLLVQQEGHPYNGWLLYQHPDGNGWVTLRKATEADLATMSEVSMIWPANHPETRDPSTETGSASLAGTPEQTEAPMPELREVPCGVVFATVNGIDLRCEAPKGHDRSHRAVVGSLPIGSPILPRSATPASSDVLTEWKREYTRLRDEIVAAFGEFVSEGDTDFGIASAIGCSPEAWRLGRALQNASARYNAILRGAVPNALEILKTLAPEPKPITAAERASAPVPPSASSDVPLRHMTHNHGPEDGPGLACREIRLTDGRMLGACLLPPKAAASIAEDTGTRDAPSVEALHAGAIACAGERNAAREDGRTADAKDWERFSAELHAAARSLRRATESTPEGK